MSDGGNGRPRGARARVLALVLVLVPLLVSAAPPQAPPQAAAEFLAFPGRYAPRGAPPPLLARLHPAVPIPPRFLELMLTRESFRHPGRAAEAADPAIAALAGASVARTRIELGYGLGRGLAARAQLGWVRFDGGAGTFPETGGGSAGRLAGFEDIALGLGAATPALGGRLAARLEAGLRLPTGSDRAYDSGSGLALTPLSRGARTGFASAGATVALAGAAAPVAVHLHAEATLRGGGRPASGMASAPFPERLPLLALGSEAHDLIDLRCALSFSRPRALIFAELDLPLLRRAGDLLGSREAPRTLSPGFALRVHGLELGAQLDLPFASDDPATAFDPRLAYPDWGLRLRIGTGLVPADRDRDGDGVGDLEDRCPGEPEDRDGFADGDGCPDPDNDGDGIADAADACPREVEDRDGHADADGCPDPDNDGDGIEDRVDLCPSSAEDPDGFEDEDGCPEPEGAPAPDAPAPGLAVPEEKGETP